jgi:hypothetical protein
VNRVFHSLPKDLSFSLLRSHFLQEAFPDHPPQRLSMSPCCLHALFPVSLVSPFHCFSAQSLREREQS